jgi:hypothetical protein
LPWEVMLMAFVKFNFFFVMFFLEKNPAKTEEKLEFVGIAKFWRMGRNQF